ncbi:hypothetical protein H6P81_009268 [Aristolochia fimbriata]|uniref:Uncharacterized protein n=1 Tax=Aristolochia fimbriata TaxID=158543 RepID=A0AAV7EKE7_ARIFI|nr:hypothetical protein H6P81_009268 [Aristolochia fimbriata]
MGAIGNENARAGDQQSIRKQSQALSRVVGTGSSIICHGIEKTQTPLLRAAVEIEELQKSPAGASISVAPSRRYSLLFLFPHFCRSAFETAAIRRGGASSDSFLGASLMPLAFGSVHD